MSIFTLQRGWFRAPKGAEKLWIGLGLFWCLVLSVAMPFSHYSGKQTSSGTAYRVEPAEFSERTQAFAYANQVDTFETAGHKQIPIVEPTGPANAPIDAYLIGGTEGMFNWEWWPILQLRKDKTYRLHISSDYYQHGFCLLPMNMNFHVLPGYDHIIELTPTQLGEFTIICNEFCGGGHNRMTGKIIVKE